jgi:DnaK suppressor protein
MNESSKKTTGERKRELESYLKDLKSEMSKVAKKGSKGYTPSFPQYGSDEDDNILEIEDFAENIRIEQKLSRLIENTEKALKKIDNNSYGICDSCGKDIGHGRLNIYPIATKCVTCAKKYQKSFWRKMWPFGR